MKKILTIEELMKSAKIFCETASEENHIELIGVTDGKAVGTYVEHKFQKFLQKRYTVEIVNSAKGIDLPGATVQSHVGCTAAVKLPLSECTSENFWFRLQLIGFCL